MSYSSSLLFMVHKGQPSKGSLSPLPLNWMFFLPSWLVFFSPVPFFLSSFCMCLFFSLFLAVFAEQWQYETQSHRAVRLQVLECWRERDSNWGKQMALASGVQPEEQVRVTWPPVTRAIWLLLACEWKERGPQSERAQEPLGHCVICGRERVRTLKWKWI